MQLDALNQATCTATMRSKMRISNEVVLHTLYEKVEGNTYKVIDVDYTSIEQRAAVRWAQMYGAKQSVIKAILGVCHDN
jgi:hypothetical protein